MNKTNVLVNQDRQFKESVIKDSLQILALYFLTVFVVYTLPGLMGHALFILFFILFYKSKKDYFWLAFWFLINTGPGGFFYITEEVATGQLPAFRLGGGVTVLVTEVFLVIAIFKALTRAKKPRIPLSKPLLMIMAYSLFLFVISFSIFGTTLIRFLKDIRYFFYYFSIIPFTYLVYKERDGEKFLYCLFPFVFVTLFTGIYFIFTGDYFINLLAPGLKSQILLGIEEGGIRFNTSGKGEHLVLLISYITALFFIFKETRLKKKNLYLLLVAGSSYVTILLSATRAWFAIFSFIFIGAVIFFKKKLKKVVGVLMIVAFLYIPYRFVPKLNDFVNRSWTRIESLFEINRETSIAYKMIEYKKKYRLSKTLEGIRESPLIGWGNSTEFYKYTGGGDVGNFNLVLQVGIIGFLVFANAWLQFFLMVRKTNRGLSPGNPYRGTIYFFSISFMGLLIAHFTTHQVFYMTPSQGYAIFIMLFLFLTGYFARQALSLEYSLIKQANTAKIQGGHESWT
jgi:hypothetical protein